MKRALFHYVSLAPLRKSIDRKCVDFIHVLYSVNKDISETNLKIIFG